MADYTIPEKDIRGFLSIVNLPASTFKNFIKHLKEIPAGIGAFEIKNYIKSADFKDESTRDAVSNVIVAIFILRFKTDQNNSEFIDDIIRGIKSSESDKITGQENWVAFKDRVIEILNIKYIGLSIKAISLRTEDDKLYVESRILTNFRPIFENSEADTFSTGIIVHNLKLEYHKDGYHKSILISLTGGELKDLKKAILRAEKKESSIILNLDNIKIISSNNNSDV